MEDTNNLQNNIYSFNDMENLANRIKKIKKKKSFEAIRDIIFDYNPTINYTENASGIFLNFHLLKQETYTAIDNYLNSL